MQEGMTQREIQHLFWRAGFGIHWAGVQSFLGVERKEVVQALFAGSQNIFSLEEEPYVVDVGEGMNFQTAQKNMSLSAEEKDKRLKENRQKVSAYALAWLQKMGSGEAALRERMTFFWHDHFATQAKLSLLNIRHHNMLRQHALGSFRDLLHAVVKDPQVLQFLNNNQSKKGQPNENLARELLELFTLGIGHYSEQDIKEAARAFTGYGFGLDGKFQFFPNRHDTGQKTFLGRTGNFEGSDIADIILEQPQTARFITEKIYKYFVTDHANEVVIKKLADNFYRSDYDISLLLREIFLSDEFYSPSVVGHRIKSPVELVAGLLRQGEMTLHQPKVLQLAFRVLGQVLCLPPNVAGWPSGAEWIDSSSLLFRSQLVEVMLRGLQVNLKEKEAISVETETLDASYYNPTGNPVARANWDTISTGLESYNAAESVKRLAAFLLQTDIEKMDWRLLDKLTQQAKTQNLESVAISIMRLPEYQLS